MTDFFDEIIKGAERIGKKVDRNKKTIMSEALMKRIQGNNRETDVFIVRTMINQCIQCGNYRRACRYIILANALLDKTEKNEQQLLQRITDIIIDSGDAPLEIHRMFMDDKDIIRKADDR